MAREVRPHEHGGPDVLEVMDVPVPTPSAGEVVVEVRAAGVNPIDWKIYSGSFHRVDDEHQENAGLAAALPRLGLECAGVVASVGADVENVRVGEEVVVYPVTGAYADYVLVPPTSLIAKPASLGWPEAGALLLAATTAAHALHAAGVGAGDTVLIHNGAGGVGLMAVQLAIMSGATVIATAGQQSQETLRDLGATPLTYGPGLLERTRQAAPDGITSALDLIGTDEALDVSLALVADRTRIASIAGGPRRAEAGIKVLGYGPGEDAGAEFRAAARHDLVAAASSGRLRVLVAATYPLERAGDAHRAGLAGHDPGKLVLMP